MKYHLLDPDSLTSTPAGYIHIASELEFLRQATENQPMVIQGSRLCNWAESYFRGRGMLFRYARSLVQELLDVCPDLTKTQAKEIATALKLNGTENLERPLTCLSALERLYPSALWQGVPSSKHVAEWLVWLYQLDPPSDQQPLLKQISRQWRDKLNEPEHRFYNVTSKEEADRCIERWVDPDERNQFSCPFMIEIPPAIADRVVARWQARIIQSQGADFSYLIKRKIPSLLKGRAAVGTADYYLANPADLNRDKLADLTPYLNSIVLNQLYEILPPDPPKPLPDSPVDILEWFSMSYFPYREWQNNHSIDEDILSHVEEAARNFADSYLRQYPGALLGQELHDWLSFNRMEELSHQTDVVTLVVVLDGLHAGDARELQQEIDVTIPRLNLTTSSFVFSPLPTVTSFCKPALFSGVPPKLVDEVQAIGQVIPDKQSPIGRLKEAVAGDLFLWRVEEPDATYHFRNSSDSLLREVRGRLGTIASNIRDIVDNVPDHVMLQIAIVTDHGRLLAKSERQVPIPPGMESHGRAAWGNSPIPLQEKSFVIQENVVYLDANSFGLPTDAAIVLDETAFLTNDNRGGSELYAHGGLYPEEVIVPWLVFARDVKEPQVTVSISGIGTARKTAELQVAVMNADNRQVLVQQLELLIGGKPQILAVEWAIPSQSERSFLYELDSWPSAEEVTTLKAEVKVSLSNKLVFVMPAEIALQSEDMYRRDNILEDLF